MRRFFEEGDKVKVTLRFRGREMAHQHLGMELLGRIQKDVEPIAKIEQYPQDRRPPDDDGSGAEVGSASSIPPSVARLTPRATFPPRGEG
jgi:hypothetical protein